MTTKNARKSATKPKRKSRSLALGTGSALRYRMHLSALKGSIWYDLETLDHQEHNGLSDAFAAGAAKAIGVTKRTGWPTRIIFVCEPNK